VGAALEWRGRATSSFSCFRPLSFAGTEQVLRAYRDGEPVAYVREVWRHDVRSTFYAGVKLFLVGEWAELPLSFPTKTAAKRAALTAMESL
jgi:hypothetical protein